MRNEFYFQVEVADEQLQYATEIVNYSLENHPIKNRWHNDKHREANTFGYRLTGSLGEIVFADLYNLPRPGKSYGAIDGQDFGSDFILKINNKEQNVDIKTMRRKSGRFYGNYVLNIPSSQLNRLNSQTDCYYCINIHQSAEKWKASVLGFFNKNEVISGKIGILYKAGMIRLRADNTTFQFQEDTYEVDFCDIQTPLMHDKIHQNKGFKILKLGG